MVIIKTYDKYVSALQEKGLSKDEIHKRERDLFHAVADIRDDILDTVINNIMKLVPEIDETQAMFYWYENKDRLIFGFDKTDIEDAND